MATRPTNSREWAESADPNDVDEPSTERPGGFQKGQDFNHDEFNWLVRELFRWIDYVDGLFQNSSGAIDLFTSVLAGDHGEFTKGQDDSNDIGATFSHKGGGTSNWIADILTASLRLRSDAIEQLTSGVISVRDEAQNPGEGGFSLDIIRQGTPSPISVEDSGGDDTEGAVQLRYLREAKVDGIRVDGAGGGSQAGDIRANLIEAAARVATDRIRPISGDDVTLQDNAGSGKGDLFAGIVEAATRLVADVLVPLSGDTLDVQSSTKSSGEGRLLLRRLRPGTGDRIVTQNDQDADGAGDVFAQNTAKAYGTILVDATNNSISTVTEFGIASVSWVSAGVYRITLADAPNTADDIVAVATMQSEDPTSNQITAMADPTAGNTDQFHLITLDASGAVGEVDGNIIHFNAFYG